MKRSFLLLALGFLGLTISSSVQAQRVAVSVNTGARCGVGYSSPGYCVTNVSAGAIYRPSPVVCYSAPVVVYSGGCYSGSYYYGGGYYSGYTPYYSGYTTGTIYSSSYGVNVTPELRIDNVGAPVVFSGKIIKDDNAEPRKLQLRTSR